MELRDADASDVPRLAVWNEQLIEDENAPYRLDRPALETRMRGWLAAEYRAVVFRVDGRAIGYALYRAEDGGFYLRQFVIDRSARRRGHGRRAIELLKARVFGPGARISLQVLNQNAVGLTFWRAVGFEDAAQTLVAQVPG
ncbi:MAG: GNAT family N-acetyltransferase [Myxococcota bacterium]